MGKTESTAVNELISLVSSQAPLKDPADNLFTEPRDSAPKKPVSAPRMSATVPPMLGGEVAPLPRGRAPHGTAQNKLLPSQVRISTAPPARAASIPPLPAVGRTPTPTGSHRAVPPPIGARATSSAGIALPPTPTGSHRVPSSEAIAPTSQRASSPSPAASSDLPVALRATRPSLPPPVRGATQSRPSLPSPARGSVPPPTMPVAAPFADRNPFSTESLAAPDMTSDQPWFEQSSGTATVDPKNEETWVGTVEVPKTATLKTMLGKLVVPGGIMIVLGVFIGGYLAFDGEGPTKQAAASTRPTAAAIATTEPAGADPTAVAKEAPALVADPTTAPAVVAAADSPSAQPMSATLPTAALPTAAPTAESLPAATAQPMTASAPSAQPATLPTTTTAVTPSTQPATLPTATTAATPSTQPAVAAKTPPSLATTTAAPTTATTMVASTATVTPRAPGPASRFVDVRIDTKPEGATVMLVDRGKTTFLGTTPLSAAVDPARTYDLVFTYANRPTQLEHLDAAATSRLDVVLGKQGGATPHLAAAAAKAVEMPAPKAAAPIAKAIEAPVGKAVATPAAKAAPVAKTSEPSVANKSEPAKKVEAPAAKAVETAPAGKAVQAADTEAPKATGAGVLMISSKPPCEIYVDGKATGMMTPQRAISLPAGSHKITLVNSAQNIKKTLAVSITADKPTKVIQDLMAK